MFQVACSYQTTAYGPLFLPKGYGRYDCDLRANFRPLAWWPFDRDAGLAETFEAEIARIEILDASDRWTLPSHERWRRLRLLWRARAVEYLERRHHDELWTYAKDLTKRNFECRSAA